MNPEKIKSAVIMAAGLGTRMRPLTDRMPKPLAEINGIPLIETSIKAMRCSGIEKIAVVTGYLGEQLAYLAEKYGNLSIVRNDNYASMNNISSVHAAFNAGFLNENSYICEGDLFIADPDVFSCDMPYENSSAVSAYFARPVNEPEYGDWGFLTDEGSLRINRIKGPERRFCRFGMIGISAWLTGDLEMLRDRVNSMMDTADGRASFWDEAADSLISEGMDVFVKPVSDGAVIEIDTVAELEELRQAYKDKKI